MKANPNVELVLPEGGIEPDSSYAERVHFMSLQEDEGKICDGELTIRYFRVTHIDFNGLEKDPHFSYIIENGGKRALVAADMKPIKESIIRVCGDKKFDIAFFNPVFIGNEESIRLMNSVNSKMNYIYHLPLEEFDQFMFRTISKNNLKKYRDLCTNVRLLLGEMEEIVF